MVWEDDIERKANLARVGFWASCGLAVVCVWLLITVTGLYGRLEYLEGRVFRLEAGMSKPNPSNLLKGGGAVPPDVISPVTMVANPGSSLLSDDEILAVIIELESEGDPKAIGADEERGLCQFTRQTWKEATTRMYGRPLSFDLAFDPETHLEVARFHLNWLKFELAKSYELSSILAAWNAGPGRAETAQFDMTKLPRSAREHIKRGKMTLSERGGKIGGE